MAGTYRPADHRATHHGRCQPPTQILFRFFSSTEVEISNIAQPIETTKKYIIQG